MSYRENFFTPINASIQDWFNRLQESCRLVFPSALTLPIQQKRIEIIQNRIRILAWILAIGTPAWGIVDALAFYHDVWVSLFVARLLTGAAFASFLLLDAAFIKRNTTNMNLTYLQLGIVFAIPILFYVFCHRLPETAFVGDPVSKVIVNSYLLMPFALLACVGLFPLTLVEALSVVAPILAIYVLTNQYTALVLWPADLGIDWIMAVLGFISVVISYSHLRMVITLVDYTAYDTLTNCLGRRSGEDVLMALWHYSVREKSRFSIAFIDLDHFKLVNDRFGHHEGDVMLASVAAAIKKTVRRSDFVIRWGGEEFLVIMPDAKIEDAANVLRRIAEQNIGSSPDGSPQTISAGIAERVVDAANDEKALIQAADQRLYQAKTMGRCRIVGLDTIVLAPARVLKTG